MRFQVKISNYNTIEIRQIRKFLTDKYINENDLYERFKKNITNTDYYDINTAFCWRITKEGYNFWNRHFNESLRYMIIYTFSNETKI